MVEQVYFLAEDQYFLRKELKRLHLTAFVADASILPRQSGVSDKPLKESIPFFAPDSLAIELTLPHKGTIRGLGIKEGITLIVGGGYHGKSTLLNALESGVYNHIAGDGREYVISDDSGVKLRAEDGRFIKDVDISLFINDLPNKKDTHCFSTCDASGSYFSGGCYCREHGGRKFSFLLLMRTLLQLISWFVTLLCKKSSVEVKSQLLLF